jgi:ribosomal protein S27AE|tara:strand:- start:678 stop:875 length:198 start_codon:yes stop_codon:yes gene_type:complete
MIIKDEDGVHFNDGDCPKCGDSLELLSLLHYVSKVEYWECPNCDAEYQVSIEVERDFEDMVEVNT